MYRNNSGLDSTIYNKVISIFGQLKSFDPDGYISSNLENIVTNPLNVRKYQKKYNVNNRCENSSMVVFMFKFEHEIMLSSLTFVYKHDIIMLRGEKNEKRCSKRRLFR